MFARFATFPNPSFNLNIFVEVQVVFLYSTVVSIKLTRINTDAVQMTGNKTVSYRQLAFC